jgi:hypothetical protein
MVSMPNDTGKIKVLSAYSTVWDASRVNVWSVYNTTRVNGW